MNWFLYAIGLRHERVKSQNKFCNNFCFKNIDSLNFYIRCGLQISVSIMQRILLRRICYKACSKKLWCLFIMRDRTSINRNIRSTHFYLFEWVFVTLFPTLCRLLWSVFKGALIQLLATESPLKLLENAFYFTLKALFILKIFKFLFLLFGHEEKWLD